MKQALFITAACLYLAQNGAAYGETPHEGKAVPASEQAAPVTSHDITRESEELSDRLDQILSQALDAQILRPAPEEEAAAELPAEQGTGQIQPAPVSDAHIPFSCPKDYPLDFEGFESLSAYHDLEGFRHAASSHDEDESGEALNEELIKARLVLGLNSEVLAELRSATGNRAAVFRQLALLMDDRQRPNVSFFRQMNACHDEAGLWLAIALLTDDQAEGASVMPKHVSAYRKLPRRLRIDVAAMTVPALEALGEPILARTLLSDFTAEEIGNSPRLQFTKALLSMGEGNPAAEDTVRSYLAQAEFRIDALAALSQSGGTFSGAEKEVLLNEVERVLGYAEDERDIAVALRFSLSELSSASDYSMMLKLADLSALQTEPALRAIERQIAADMKRDFSGDDSIRKMAAVDALLTDSDILKHISGVEDLYHMGAEFASGAGYDEVAEKLLLRSGATDLADRKQAEIAYRRGDNEALFRLAADHPHDSTISLFAALAAVRTGDAERVRRYEGGLQNEPASLLALLEMDAAEGHWVVSPALYDAGSALVNEDLKARAERAVELRDAARSQAAEGSRARPDNIGEALSRSREAFRHLGKEAL